ncbi:MAG: hypothetical protein IKL31_06350 [Ruminococcus sp.]|nr:hypothetical protein [Ruminococcus sp.]
MTLMELQNILGERVLMMNNTDMSIEERKKEAEISQTISSLAKQMINNADVVLRTEKLVAEGKLQNSSIERLIK